MQQGMAWPGSPTGRSGFLLAIGVTLVAFFGALYQFTQDWSRILALKPIELHLQAFTAENGGWRSELLRAESGRQVLLHVHGKEGAHTFAIARTGVQSSQLLAPGDQEVISFTAPAPGRYVLYCTTWCSPNHWRMRTVLEVVDPAQPAASLGYAQEAHRYPLLLDPMLLDMPHPAAVWPQQPPDANLGREIWQQLASTASAGELLAGQGWPMLTPEQLYQQLAAGEVPDLGAAQALDATTQWALVAYLWQQNTPPTELARGAELYRQNCADCHGASGRGDGVSAAFSVGEEPDLTDLRSAAGASPALYYAKIARGGMGTGMPNWGTILGEDELWALTVYLVQFMFEETYVQKEP